MRLSCRSLRDLFADESGATAVEYGLIAGLIVVALLAGLALDAAPVAVWPLALLPLSAFLIDAGYTLATRVLRGERWWTPHVERFRELGITAGCGNNRYCPNDNVKRWQMAIFLVSALGEAPTPSHRGYFVDVGPNHPQRGQIERLRTEFKSLQIDRIWKNLSKRALITQSTHTVQARPAQQPGDGAGRNRQL